MMKTIFLMIKIIFLAVLLSACTIQPERIVYLPVPVDIPVKPDIPKISSKDMACLSDATKNKLVARDTVIKNYIFELESTIQSTKPK